MCLPLRLLITSSTYDVESYGLHVIGEASSIAFICQLYIVMIDHGCGLTNEVCHRSQPCKTKLLLYKLLLLSLQLFKTVVQRYYDGMLQL